MNRRVLLAWLMLTTLIPAVSFAADGPSLRLLAERRGLAIGANLPGLIFGKAPNNWEQSPTIRIEQSIAAEHFSIMTAGWEMYPGQSWLAPGRYEFRGSDVFIRWCQDHNLSVHGHGLGYGCRVDWLKKFPVRTPEEKAAVRELYEAYIRDTVRHFAGRVHVWDVCNEQLLPAYTFSGYQTAQPYWKAYQDDPRDPESGVEWYRRTFHLAHEADPKAKLILLDFNNEIVCPKSDRMFRLVRELQADGVPVHGVGFQMHLTTELNRSKGHGLETDGDYYRSLTENFRRFSGLGVELWITELDVSIDTKKELEAELDRQASIYGEVVSIAVATPNFRGIKFWGIIDRSPWGEVIATRPFLFDETGRPKAAFYAVRNALAIPE